MKDNIIVSVIFGTGIFFILIACYWLIVLIVHLLPVEFTNSVIEWNQGEQLTYVIPLINYVIIYVICIICSLIVNLSVKNYHI